MLSNLVTAVKAGDNPAIGQGLDALGRALARAIQAQTQVGTSLNALDAARTQLGREHIDTASRISKLRDANMASAISEMTESDTSYRAALAAFSKIGSVSLLDYLR